VIEEMAVRIAVHVPLRVAVAMVVGIAARVPRRAAADIRVAEMAEAVLRVAAVTPAATDTPVAGHTDKARKIRPQ